MEAARALLNGAQELLILATDFSLERWLELASYAGEQPWTQRRILSGPGNNRASIVPANITCRGGRPTPTGNVGALGIAGPH